MLYQVLLSSIRYADVFLGLYTEYFFQYYQESGYHSTLII
jgi:hypothetical protein